MLLQPFVPRHPLNQLMHSKLYFRHILLGILFVFATLLILDSYYAPGHFRVLDITFSKMSKYVAKSSKHYAIDTPGCKIPEMDPFDESIQKFIEAPPPFHCPCENGHGLTYLEDNLLKVNTDILVRFTADTQKDNFYCCVWAMYRYDIEEHDDFMRYPEKCTQFRDSIPVTAEYLKAECYLNAKRIHETFHINLIKKPKVEERCNNASRTCPLQDKMGVIILFVDSVSRVNFRRNFPESQKVLVEELRAIEMHGYNRVADNTFPNLVPLLTGLSEAELRETCWKNETNPFDDCHFLWQDFAAAGFRTAFIEDYPDIAAFNFEKSGFQKQPTDYYGHDFLKEAYKLMFQQRDCLNGISETEVTFKWCHDFMKFFRYRKYFGLFATSRFTHHNDVNRARLADPILKKYLRAMKYDNIVDNTFLFIISDHGARYGDFRDTGTGGREVNLPAFYVVPPKSFAVQLPKAFYNLAENAHRLTTPYDLHETLRDIVHCNFDPQDSVHRDATKSRMASLFRKIPTTRSCLDTGIPKSYCSCFVKEINLRSDLDIVQESYRLLIAMLNNITKPYRNVCAQFDTNSVLRARQVLSSASESFYEITFFVKPGVGLFQGIVTGGPNLHSLVADPEISRLDMYGNTSSCIAQNS